MIGEILIPKSDNYDNLLIRLPGKTLSLDRVDFSTQSLIFGIDERESERDSRLVKDGDLDVLGISKHGGVHSLRDIIPLAAYTRALLKMTLKGLPVTLDHPDRWYLTASGTWKGADLTDGAYLVDTISNGLVFRKTKSKPRPFQLDPVGVDNEDGWPCLPLRRAVEMITQHEGAFADPYAWSTRHIPRQRGRGYTIEVLVIGPKT